MGEQRPALTLLLILCFAVSSISEIGIVKAEPKTIIVPDDYSTITSAISNANNGDTVLLREGTYEGPINQTIVVDKTLSIVGESIETTILKLYPAFDAEWIMTPPFFNPSDAIAIDADNFKLLNLSIVIANRGGYISATGNQLQIIGTKITGLVTDLIVNGNHCKITDNLMDGHIRFEGAYSELERNSFSSLNLRGSWNGIKDNVCAHIGLANSDYNTISGNTVKSSTSIYDGISLVSSNSNLVSDNFVSGRNYGFLLWEASNNNTITANTIAGSLSASISFGGSSNNTIFLNNFSDNSTPYVYDYYDDPNYRLVYPNWTLSTNSWDKDKQGNYWSKYKGTDLDNDGIGDSPYILNDKNQDKYPLVEQPTIPEFPSWTTLPIILAITMFSIIVKRKLHKTKASC